MQIEEQFLDVVSQFQLRHKKLLLAVSGGIDSVVLCELCKNAGLQFAIAHCNFQLRGAESTRDQEFVKSLATKYNASFYLEQFDTVAFAAEHKLSVQEAARKLRYDFFNTLIQQHHLDYTLLAHHADDNLESLLMNFFRGTGLDGLTGMPMYNPAQAKALRPLLNVRRAEILQYAKVYQLQWVEDSSNESSKYTRNYFRNEWLPAVKKVYQSADENLLDNINRFQKIKSLYQHMLADLKQKLYKRKGAEVHIPILQLMKYSHTSLLYEVIHEFGFGEHQLTEVYKLMKAESGKYIANDEFQVIKHRNWLIIAPVALPHETIIIDKGQDLVLFPDGKFSLKNYSADKWKLNASLNVAQIDASHVEWPLVFRKWRTGDYFYPLGLRKKKKLSRFFIDQKMSKSDKENVWVVESHKKIIWIAGRRIDDRFKVTDRTTSVLEITLTNL